MQNGFPTVSRALVRFKESTFENMALYRKLFGFIEVKRHINKLFTVRFNQNSHQLPRIFFPDFSLTFNIFPWPEMTIIIQPMRLKNYITDLFSLKKINSSEHMYNYQYWFGNETIIKLTKYNTSYSSGSQSGQYRPQWRQSLTGGWWGQEWKIGCRYGLRGRYSCLGGGGKISLQMADFT